MDSWLKTGRLASGKNVLACSPAENNKNISEIDVSIIFVNSCISLGNVPIGKFKLSGRFNFTSTSCAASSRGVTKLGCKTSVLAAVIMALKVWVSSIYNLFNSVEALFIPIIEDLTTVVWSLMTCIIRSLVPSTLSMCRKVVYVSAHSSSQIPNKVFIAEPIIFTNPLFILALRKVVCSPVGSKYLPIDSYIYFRWTDISLKVVFNTLSYLEHIS
ncbi:hypothetical protein AGLY_003331 [Aphis glycines]|uniref:Uncharacterized protein n=1 Tax=Aphis glycines TaxID=307491 RepID=A0A6G0U110_APHGL|nr:hypothetical protein AGLY_003331 [Aphis glycines]